MTGLNKYSDKERRKMRLQNKIARDLRTPKYKQRRVEGRRKEDYNKKLTVGSREWYAQFEEDTDID